MQTHPSCQLELELPFEGEAAGHLSAPFRPFVITPDTTPASIVQWWDELCAAIDAARDTAAANAAALDAELATLRAARGGDAGQRKRMLRAQRQALAAAAELVDVTAHAAFEAALDEFSPRLVTLLQAAGLRLEHDDNEHTIARFWDCLQRPAIEHVATSAIRDIAPAFAAELLAERETTDAE